LQREKKSGRAGIGPAAFLECAAVSPDIASNTGAIRPVRRRSKPLKGESAGMKWRIQESSSTALLALSALFLAPGMLILSPDGRLFFLVLAGLVSAIVLIAAPSRKKRIAAAVGLLLAVALAIPAWWEYRAHSHAWKKHVLLPQEQNSKQGLPAAR
jgi:hypothetical protein